MLSPSATLPQSVAERFADDFQCWTGAPLLPQYIAQLDVLDNPSTLEIVYRLTLSDGHRQV